MLTKEGIYLILVLNIITSICFKGISSLGCFECNDVFKPYSCDIVTKCTDNEECFLDQYVTSSGTVLFKSGCRSTQRCSVAKREAQNYVQVTNVSVVSDMTSDIIVCSTCCKDTDYCNIEGCQEHILPKQNRGPLCFDCLNQGKLTCRHVTQCDINYACEISSREQNGVIYYDSKCVHVTSLSSCNSTNGRSLPSFIGKRATEPSNYCPKCCVDDFCNEDCTQPPNNGGYGDWSTWSTCSNTCGGVGQQQRTRHCRQTSCIGPAIDTRDCVNKDSCSVGSAKETWTSWSSCSSSCGGTKRRSKICFDNSGSIDISLCSAPLIDEVQCSSLFDCDDGWDLWHRWTSCSSRTCGQGYQWRNRHCDKGIHQCVGFSQEWRNCNGTRTCNGDLCQSIPNYNDYHFVIYAGRNHTPSDICLHYSTEMLDWSTASSKCHTEGGKLAVFDSADEDEEAFQHTSRFNYPVRDVKIWIGLRYVNGDWRWEDGSPIGSYVISALGKNYTEVANIGFTNGACVLDQDRQWSLVDCNEKHYYMYERDVI